MLLLEKKKKKKKPKKPKKQPIKHVFKLGAVQMFEGSHTETLDHFTLLLLFSFFI